MALQEWQRVLVEKMAEVCEDNWSFAYDENIEAHKQKEGWYQYIRGAVARFACSKCKRTWYSKRVPVIFHFHLHPRTREGLVKARRLRQECRRCSQPKMQAPQFAYDNIDVLLEKLRERILTRCYGAEVDKNNRMFRSHGRSQGPHESAHCEACQQGICTRAE